MKRLLDVIFTKGLILTVATHLGLILCSFLVIDGVRGAAELRWHWAYSILGAISLGTVLLVAVIYSIGRSENG